MENLFEFITDETFISLVVGIMGIFVSFIVGIASYLVGSNININPNISGLNDKVNYIKLSSKIEKILELKKGLLEKHGLIGLYFFIALSFFFFLFIIIQEDTSLRILLTSLLFIYSYIFLRLSYVIVKILKYNLSIDRLYHELMKNNMK